MMEVMAITTALISNQNLKKIFKGLAVMLGLFFSLQIDAAGLKIGIIDTGFCGSAFVFDATNSVKMKCPAGKSKDFRYHGQWVLQQLNYTGEVFPVIVFDKDKKQKEEYWVKALQYLKEKQVDVVLMATSLPFTTKTPALKLEDKVIYYVAAGQTGLGINAQTKLWPQVLGKKQNMIVIGAYLEEDKSPMEHPRLLNKELVDFYFTGEKIKGSYLKSSSLAVTLALKKALSLCPHPDKVCLMKKSKPIKLWPLKKEFLTY